jgi:hypothetical protein
VPAAIVPACALNRFTLEEFSFVFFGYKLFRLERVMHPGKELKLGAACELCCQQKKETLNRAGSASPLVARLIGVT